ncbi:MAG TPA: hypothetical protein VH917_05450 [Ignavibacteriaceae bacterium]|jgi:hypothetical protein
MKHKIEFFFILFCLMFLIGCSSGKDVFVDEKDRMNAVNSIAIIGFPGQCTLDDKQISFLTIAFERIDSLNLFKIASMESTFEIYDALSLSPIYPYDEYTTLDVQGLADLCYELEVDAVVVGFYRIRIQDAQPTTYVDENGQRVTTSSPSYLQNFPTFEVCIIGQDGSLLFRGVSEGRETGFWHSFWDSIFQSESDESYYDRVQDSMDGICEMLKN